MARAIKFAAVVVCLACILAICIAPLADLPATSLRSYLMAVILMWWLVASAFSLILSSIKASFRTWVILPEPMGRKKWNVEIPIGTRSILRC
jgi:hypothetical protein